MLTLRRDVVLGPRASHWLWGQCLRRAKSELANTGVEPDGPSARGLTPRRSADKPMGRTEPLQDPDRDRLWTALRSAVPLQALVQIVKECNPLQTDGRLGRFASSRAR